MTGVDTDLCKLESIRQRRTPEYEPGLEQLIHASSRRLKATNRIEEAVAASDVTFIVVATPSDPNGSFSLRYVLPVCESVGHALAAKQAFHLVALTSTVMPGATGGPVLEALEHASKKRAGRDFGLCYNPEFVALGSVIRDFLHPDFVLIGESDPTSGAMLEELYARVHENAPPVARMSFVNAEITKLSVNTYLTAKISQANLLAPSVKMFPEPTWIRLRELWGWIVV